MRFRRGMRLLGSAALSLFLLTGASGCSSQQQDEEGLETEQDGSDQAANENGGENQATDEGGEEGANEQAAAEGGEEQPAENNGTASEQDLNEIIQEMNGPQTAGEAPADGAAPVDTGANLAGASNAFAPAPEAAPAESDSTALPFQPGGSPAAPGLPEVGSKMAYIVQFGDTLGKISAKIYGNGGRWQELASLSGITNPSRIFPGDLVYYTLDESALAFATAYETIQRSEEQVKPGDTLASIAQRVYGDTREWRSIWRQNDNIQNPDIIPPNSTVFYVPKGALTAHVKKVRANLAKVTRAATINSDIAVAKTATADLATVSASATTNTDTQSDASTSNTIASNGFNLANVQLGYSIENVLGSNALTSLN